MVRSQLEGTFEIWVTFQVPTVIAHLHFMEHLHEELFPTLYPNIPLKTQKLLWSLLQRQEEGQLGECRWEVTQLRALATIHFYLVGCHEAHSGKSQSRCKCWGPLRAGEAADEAPVRPEMQGPRGCKAPTTGPGGAHTWRHRASWLKLSDFLGAPGFSLKPAWPRGPTQSPTPTSFWARPHPTIGPQRDPDSAADTVV